MSRFVLILLLLIFPFQVTLAAADLCCGYGSETRHVPCELAERSGQARDPVHAVSNIDVHCALCVFASAAYLPSHIAAPRQPALEGGDARPTAPHHFASHAAPRPERPQWPRLT